MIYSYKYHRLLNGYELMATHALPVHEIRWNQYADRKRSFWTLLAGQIFWHSRTMFQSLLLPVENTRTI